jgi:F-type H+-transporting ATPase subunit delta
MTTMKGGRLLAREYARVLDRLAPAERTEIQSYFRGLGDLLGLEKDLRTFFNHPAIPDAEKMRFLESITPRHFGPVVGRVLGDIIKRRISVLFTAIADEMVRLSDEALHIRPVLVTSAQPLVEPQREELTEKLQTYLSGRVKMRFAVDASLLAGFSIQTEDTVLDNSIRTDLEHIRRKLKTVSST